MRQKFWALRKVVIVVSHIIVNKILVTQMRHSHSVAFPSCFNAPVCFLAPNRRSDQFFSPSLVKSVKSTGESAPRISCFSFAPFDSLGNWIFSGGHARPATGQELFPGKLDERR